MIHTQVQKMDQTATRVLSENILEGVAELESCRFWEFDKKKRCRKVIEDLKMVQKDGKMIKRTAKLSGIYVADSQYEEGKKRYITEISGCICQIDEAVCSDVLEIVKGEYPRITISEIASGTFCTSIKLEIPDGALIDVSGIISVEQPSRSVIIGKYETAIDDMKESTEGFYPHEQPDYVKDEHYWFHFYDECYRFMQAYGCSV